MNVPLRKPRITRDQFLAWARRQDARYELHAGQPVAMTGGTVRHNQIAHTIHFALRSRLARSGCRPLGMDAGLATVSDTVRYPDALVTCAPVADDCIIVPDVVVVFEVLSPTSGQTDRFVKTAEYRAVPSIRRYIIVECEFIGLTVLERADQGQDWTATTLGDGATLLLPEMGTAVPVRDIYVGTELARTGDLAGTEASDAV